MIRVSPIGRLPAFVIAALFGSIADVNAMPTLQTVVAPIYQVGNGAGVNMGHVVSASTIYNRLTAGGTFSASCASPLMLPATGQRTLSNDGLTGGRSLVVTIPEWVPTIINMPGFYSLTRGTTVACTYNWTARTVEGGYTIGAGGITFQTGNGERTQGSFQAFVMSVPGDTSSDDFQSCIP